MSVDTKALADEMARDLLGGTVPDDDGATTDVIRALLDRLVADAKAETIDEVVREVARMPVVIIATGGCYVGHTTVVERIRALKEKP